MLVDRLRTAFYPKRQLSTDSVYVYETNPSHAFIEQFLTFTAKVKLLRHFHVKWQTAKRQTRDFLPYAEKNKRDAYIPYIAKTLRRNAPISVFEL